jgi:hypothetical protein
MRMTPHQQMLAEARDTLFAIPGAALPKFPQYRQQPRKFPIGGPRSVIAHREYLPERLS